MDQSSESPDPEDGEIRTFKEKPLDPGREYFAIIACVSGCIPASTLNRMPSSRTCLCSYLRL